MDIKSLYTLEAHNRGSEMNIRGPGKGRPLTDCFLTISGFDSIAWRDSEKEGYRKITKMAMPAEAGKAPTQEQLSYSERLIMVESLAGAVTGWRGFENEGEPLEFDRNFLIELIMQAPHIQRQIDKYIDTHENFI